MEDKFLVKFKDGNITDETSYIEAFFTDDVVNILQVVKHIDRIRIGDSVYQYESSEYLPAYEDGRLNVLVVYLFEYDC